MAEKRTFRINVTKAAMSAIKPAASGRGTYPGDGVRGLQLRANYTRVKTFSVFRWVGYRQMLRLAPPCPLCERYIWP